MKLQLPPRVSLAAFQKGLTAFESVVGKEWVLATDSDRETYRDVYQPADDTNHAPGATVAPASADEVQALLRLANEHKIPLWPISRGKNMGYGGSAPVLSGSVILDLSRMNRILDVDVKHGHCLLEPGVGFFQLHEYLQAQKIPLWLSVPANAWGSVIGNALDRGIGYTPYGENTAQLCGLEVALPSGDLVRTGMGAMSNSRAWQGFRYGFGPSWDQMFVQSNFGVVTKGGMWLMPEPEATLTMTFSLPEPEDIVWALDALSELRLRRVIETSVTIGNYIRNATMLAQRDEWYRGAGSMPESVGREMMKKLNLGWWNSAISLFGYADVIEANARIVKQAFANLKGGFQEKRWQRGEPLENSAANLPAVRVLRVVNWWGGRGGHLGFSPVLPFDGKEAFAQFQRTRKHFEEFGHDYYGGFTTGERYLTNVNEILYDRDNADQARRARALFDVLVKDAAKAGYGEYRTHLSYMDDVADSFDFNHRALRRLNETVKDALDPNGIVAPGKSGIWPRAYRSERA